MLATSICREVHFTVLPTTTMNGSSRVPRSLFGSPNPRETAEMLQEALEAERRNFIRRWGVDPHSENKENTRTPSDHPNRNLAPNTRQTNIHDYWPSRKPSDTGKKPLVATDGGKQQYIDTKSSIPYKNSM